MVSTEKLAPGSIVGIFFEKEQSMQTDKTDSASATPEQLAMLTGEFALALAKAKPSAALMQHLLRSRVATRKMIIAALSTQGRISHTIDPRLVQCQKLWEKLGVVLDCMDNLVMPEIPSGWRGIAIIPPLTNEALLALCKKHFPIWSKRDGLDNILREQNRPRCTYVVVHRGGMEPDKEHRNKSHDDAVNEGLYFLTLKERICIELLHFIKTGKHFDVKGTMTVTSSLTMGGDAFNVYWSSHIQTFIVDGCSTVTSYSTNGLRQAVFFGLKPYR